MASNWGQITQHQMPLSWRGREARVAAYPGKMHGGKSVQGLAVARGECGEITGGGGANEFDCINKT